MFSIFSRKEPNSKTDMATEIIVYQTLFRDPITVFTTASYGCHVELRANRYSGRGINAMLFERSFLAAAVRERAQYWTVGSEAGYFGGLVASHVINGRHEESPSSMVRIRPLSGCIHASISMYGLEDQNHVVDTYSFMHCLALRESSLPKLDI